MKRRNNNLESTTEKVSRILSEKYAVQVIFQGSECKTDGTVICLPSLPEDIPRELEDAVKGWADHEVAHILFTENEAGRKFREKHGNKAFGILNTLEDARVERLMAGRYPGSGINIDRAIQHLTALSSRSGKKHRDPFKAFTAALYLRASGREDLAFIPEGAYRMAGRCHDELVRVHECRNTREVSELAESILNKLPDDLSLEGEKNEQKQKQNGETQTGSGDEPEEKSSDGAEDENQGGSESGEQDGGGQGEEKTEGQAGEDGEDRDGSEPAGALHGEGQDTEEGEDGGFSGAKRPSGPGSAPMDDLRSRIESYVQSRDVSSVYRPYTCQHDTVEVPETDPSYNWREDMRVLRPKVSGLLRKLVHTLRGREEKLWRRERSRGKLDPGALHKLVAGKDGRIFRTRKETEDGHTACTLLLDLSASMRGPQLRLCRQLGLIFGETLSRLDFPTEIIGFSTVDRDLRHEVHKETGIDEKTLSQTYSRMVPLYHGVYKSFSEPWSRGACRMGSIRARSLTPLGESLLFAGKRLAWRPEKRKVLLCLTDGEPVTGAWNESVTMQHACEAVEKLSSASIEPIGLGIMTDCVQNIFPRCAVIHDLSQLPTTFSRQLCDVLTERSRKPAM